MNVCVFYGNNDFSAIDNSIKYLKEGNNLFVVHCDSSLGVCMRNKCANPFCCKYCNFVNKRTLKSLLREDYKYYHLREIIKDKDKKLSENINLQFKSITELKSLVYESLDIGYGAFSSYATMTRNVMPEISDDFRKYMQFVMRKEIMVYEAMKRFVDENKIDLIVFHNGRFAQFKPFLALAIEKKIDYIATEHGWRGGKAYSNYFYNDVPHSVKANIDKLNTLWNSADEKERNKIGVSFFEKRKKGIKAGDVVYTTLQKKDLLPEVWNPDLENIAIFNSSEDEYCAVSKDYDNRQLFPNQYVALETIFDHYKDDCSKHFYLRIHPNLKNVRFRSHLDLYKLKYENVTIIPPDSQISSYALMENSNKIIVFNSTMGIESSYWGKPVIALTKEIATELGCTYHPSMVKDLWPLIESDLKCLNNENAIKLGYYYLRESPAFRYLDVKVIHKHLFKKDLSSISIEKFLGSYLFNDIILLFFSRNIFINRLFSKFKEIPESQPKRQ